jgi:hypothetical protein
MAGTAAADEVLADRSVRHKHQLRRQEKPPMDSISMISTSGSASPAEPTSSTRSRSKHLPASSILSPSTLITRLCFRDWRRAAGTRLRPPCAFWTRAACHSPVVSSGLAVNLIGQIRPGLVILYRLRVKCWTLDSRDPGKVEGLPLCKA